VRAIFWLEILPQQASIGRQAAPVIAGPEAGIRDFEGSVPVTEDRAAPPA
jgi:hypothetical protein